MQIGFIGKEVKGGSIALHCCASNLIQEITCHQFRFIHFNQAALSFNFRRVFGTDIDLLRGVEDLWKMRRAPDSLDLDTILPGGAAEAKLQKTGEGIYRISADEPIYCSP